MTDDDFVEKLFGNATATIQPRPLTQDEKYAGLLRYKRALERDLTDKEAQWLSDWENKQPT